MAAHGGLLYSIVVMFGILCHFFVQNELNIVLYVKRMGFTGNSSLKLSIRLPQRGECQTRKVKD